MTSYRSQGSVMSLKRMTTVLVNANTMTTLVFALSILHITVNVDCFTVPRTFIKPLLTQNSSPSFVYSKSTPFVHGVAQHGRLSVASTALLEAPQNQTSSIDIENESTVDINIMSNDDTGATTPNMNKLSTAASRSAANVNRQALSELNEKLNKYATACGDSTQPIVAQAATCQRMWENSDTKTDVVSLNIVLKAWARVCQTLAEHVHNDQHDYLLDVSTPIYTARDAAERALYLLNQQEEKYQQFVATKGRGNGDDENSTKSVKPIQVIAPDTASYNIVMDAWAKSRTPEAPTQVESLLQVVKETPRLHPDSLSYNALIDAYAYSNHPDNIERLWEISQEMDNISKSSAPGASNSNNNNVRSTVRTLNSILHAYSRRISRLDDPIEKYDLAMQCYDIMQKMHKKYGQSNNPADQPDIMTYTNCMEAFSQVGTLEATLKAQALFDELLELQKTSQRFQPSIYTYVTLLKSWSRIYDPQSVVRCEALLELLLEHASTNKSLVPNARAFNAVIVAWARSHDVHKAVKALQIVQRMKKLASSTWPEVTPTQVTYNTALDACAKTRGDSTQKRDALKIAMALFKSMQVTDKITPNHVTFATLLRAVSFLMPAGPERNQIALAIWQRVVNLGQVDVNVIKSLQKCLDSQVLHDTLQCMADHNGRIKYDQIPAAWNKHVR